MQVTLEIPDILTEQFTAAGKDPARVVLEAVMVEGYRTHQISEGQTKRTLGYQTRMEVHDLLKQHGVELNYGVEELQQDMETIRRLEARENPTAAGSSLPTPAH
jgi:predicted HTH domain antitoxin